MGHKKARNRRPVNHDRASERSTGNLRGDKTSSEGSLLKVISEALFQQEKLSWQAPLQEEMCNTAVSATTQIKPAVMDTNEEQFKLWNEARLCHPKLELQKTEGGALNWLVTADWEESLKHYTLVSLSVKDQKYDLAAKQLIDFYEESCATFLSSGWVERTIGILTLRSPDSARKFSIEYRRSMRRSREKSMRAIEVLSIYTKEHEQHLVGALAGIKAYFKTQHSLGTFCLPGQRELFPSRAAEAYETTGVPCACLSREVVMRLADTVFEETYSGDREMKIHELKDRALARIADISHKTLTGVRAGLNKSGS